MHEAADFAEDWSRATNIEDDRIIEFAIERSQRERDQESATSWAKAARGQALEK